MSIEELSAIAEKTKAGRKEVCVRCCMSAGCMSSRADEIKKALEQTVASRNLGDKIEIRRVGCMGFCGQGPLVTVKSEDLLYEFVTPESAPGIIEALDGGANQIQRGNPNHPFFAHQVPVVRGNGGLIDPERIEDYIEVGGYTALEHAISELTPAQIVESITQSGLRGRGGAGFPTGL